MYICLIDKVCDFVDWLPEPSVAAFETRHISQSSSFQNKARQIPSLQLGDCPLSDRLEVGPSDQYLTTAHKLTLPTSQLPSYTLPNADAASGMG